LNDCRISHPGYLLASENQVLFADRREAGRRLAARLHDYAGSNPIVLALPRGGIPVAYEVARALGAPLDVFIVRKLGVPGHEEFALGAIASGDVVVLNPELVNQLGLSRQDIQAIIEAERRELDRRERAYREGAPPLDVRGRTVILVDDGLATGATMLAAIAALRKLGPARIIVAVPVAAPETCEAMAGAADEVVCAVTPQPFHAVGLWYENFAQTTDDEVRALLQAARAASPQPAAP
jgi:predicted phosphoribosyltransferase